METSSTYDDRKGNGGPSPTTTGLSRQSLLLSRAWVSKKHGDPERADDGASSMPAPGLTSNHLTSHLLLRPSCRRGNKDFPDNLPGYTPLSSALPAPPARAPWPVLPHGGRAPVGRDPRLRAALRGYLFVSPGRQLHRAWLVEGLPGH